MCRLGGDFDVSSLIFLEAVTQNRYEWRGEEIDDEVKKMMSSCCTRVSHSHCNFIKFSNINVEHLLHLCHTMWHVYIGTIYFLWPHKS
jgi:hypothetical protein